MADFKNFFKELNDMTDDLADNFGVKNDTTDLTTYHSSIDLEALSVWGGEDQIFMLIEEVSELIQAISKRKRGLTHNIAEEVADVEIMLSQIKMYLDLGDEVYKWKNFKYERMRKALEKHE